jgi:hypothetical protein
MYLYKKITKSRNITYYVGQNNANSKDMFVLADLSKIKKDAYEEVVAWANKKSKEIIWNEDFENVIDKNLIKNFIVQL